MSKHTPGPWTVRGHAIEHDFPETDETMVVGYVEDNGPSGPEAAANARLIAAAPDLLAALESFELYPLIAGIEGHHATSNCNDSGQWQLVEAYYRQLESIRAAIAAAKGTG